MPTTTPELGLFKKDPATDGATNFDLKTMINDNLDKIDADATVNKNHRNNTSNPHNTTAAQVGAYTKAEADSMAQAKADQAETDAINWAKGFGLGTVAAPLAAGVDLNTVIVNGFYRVNAGVNAPPRVTGDNTSIWHYLIVIAHDVPGGYLTQIAVEYNTNTMFTRSKHSSTTWTAWSQIETTTGSQAKATAAANGVQTNLTNHIGTGGTAHAAVVAGGANGFMTGADKTKLDGIATGANNYSHPTGDGNLHVPATGTTNNLKVLKAGATAGSAAWGNVAFSELTSKPTTLSGYGITDAAPSSHVTDTGNPHATTAAQVGAYTKAEADAKYETPTGAQTKATAAQTAAQDWAKGFGLGTTAKGLADGTDFNSITETGFYSVGNNPTNAPETGTYTWDIIHIRNPNTGYATQYALKHEGTLIKVFTRQKTVDTWSAWSQMETTAGAQAKANAVQTNLTNHIGTGGTAHAAVVAGGANGFMTGTDKTKLDGIATGAEVNQNAFANVKVGATTIAADAKSDILELVAGSRILLTPDATNDKVTFAVDNSDVHVSRYMGFGVDWNGVQDPGTYRIQSEHFNTAGSSNYPTNAIKFGTLVVYKLGDSVTQVYYEHLANAGAGFWFRTKWNASDWTDWSRSSSWVEKGSNANGEYIKYDDGRMVCWYVDSNPANYFSWSANPKNLNGIYYYYVTGNWNFPAAFLSKPAVFASGDIPNVGVENHAAWNPATNWHLYAAREHGTWGGEDPRNATATMNTSLYAIGRWK